MGKPKYEFPTTTFPYKISRRLNDMSVPRKLTFDKSEFQPAYTPRGIRKSAINGQASDRINDVALPYIRRFILLKKSYKNRFSPERLERIDRMIEATNSTPYAKLANCVMDMKKSDGKDKDKKKKAWSESEWKKHMDYISQISTPKPDFPPPIPKRGPGKPLEELLPRINEISALPTFKIYKRQSQEMWYRDPIKVPQSAMKYVASERTKQLAIPRKIPAVD